jgi:ribose transport system substrate-binding protein
VGQDTNEWAKLLLDGRPGAVVTNPAVIGGAGLTVALQAINGENPEQTTKITPQVWDLADNKSALEASYFADQDQMMSSATSIEGLTHFNNDQLFSCKGPGE